MRILAWLFDLLFLNPVPGYILEIVLNIYFHYIIMHFLD